VAPRSWGWWTEQKLDILGDYLAAFTTACKRAGQTVYLDLFAGQPDNVSRDGAGRVIRGSARRALDTQPPLSVLRFSSWTPTLGAFTVP
jgi:three-Cys-motif partner protein